jgi:hypothetical protein
MTTDHWLAIAVIISTLIAPLMPSLAGWATKPRARPETNQPNARSHWIIRLSRSSFAFPLLFAILPNAFVLYYYDLRQPVTVTTRVVADVCFHVVAIAYGIILIITNRLMRLSESQTSLIERIIGTLEAEAKHPVPKVTKRLPKKHQDSN